MKLTTRLLLFAAIVALPALASAQDATAVVGQPAPDFSLTDEAGNTHTLSGYEGRIVVLEWTNPQCPYVVRHYGADTMENLSAQFGDDVVWLAVNSSHFNTAADSVAWKGSEGFTYPTLLDADGTVGHRYGARTTPHMFVVDAEGTLAYAGAIDDDPRGNGASVNYVEQAVTSLLAGDQPPVTSSEPYGCSVKYE